MGGEDRQDLLTFELLCSFWIILVLIWMPFQSGFSVCFLDVLLGGIGPDAQSIVEFCVRDHVDDWSVICWSEE